MSVFPPIRIGAQVAIIDFMTKRLSESVQKCRYAGHKIVRVGILSSDSVQLPLTNIDCLKGSLINTNDGRKSVFASTIPSIKLLSNY